MHYDMNLSFLDNVTSEKLRSNLRHYLDKVQMREARFCIVRRGRAVAGLVPIHEARALWEVDTQSMHFLELRMREKLDRQRALRDAILAQRDRADER
ncbi:type II toxin-antitoxin system prevent-host-death family antitoxin [Salipiger sp.]|uniref:type II toxin-antitoxin system prevent-host-death family antitoxin n=1 Tax=Salipiger sp. TaxID=2078585 RepID=UPI003A97A58A